MSLNQNTRNSPEFRTVTPRCESLNNIHQSINFSNPAKILGETESNYVIAGAKALKKID